MLFQVRRYNGAAEPHNGYDDVEAENPQQAAEQACGEDLTDRGKPGMLRATVHRKPPVGTPFTFYAKI